MYHSLAPYTDSWELVDGTQKSSLYYWFGWLLYSAMLETFVFISGYLYGYTSKNRPQILWKLVIGKFKRLIIPCIIWGLLFVVIVSPVSELYERITSPTTYVKIATGIAHLWFLPMLFWCFLFEYTICKLKNNNTSIFILFLFVIAILPYPWIPFNINVSLYYLFFFHLGYLLYNCPKTIRKFETVSNRNIFFLTTIYIILFVSGTLLRDSIDLENISSQILKRQYISLIQISRLIYSIVGVSIYLILGSRFEKRIKGTKFSNVVNFVAINSFGIYLFQEIVLRFVYYKTDLGLYCGNLTPFVAFSIAFSVSLSLSYLIRSNRILKSLL